MHGAWALLYLVSGGFFWKVTNGTENPTGMEDYLWEHQVKKTFCDLVQKQAVYRQERLDIYCAAKVKFFQDQVKWPLVAMPDLEPYLCSGHCPICASLAQ